MLESQILVIVFIAIGLSMDSFAVSITSGLCLKKLNRQQYFKIAGFLAFFQAGFPVIGWFIGHQAEKYIKEFDHWIAFGLLLFLGGKMIYDGLKNDDEKECTNPLQTKTLIGLSVATSIDALIVGTSFGLLTINILPASLIIGVTTLLFSLAGLYIGVRFGKKFRFNSEVFGGVVLIGIGIKILIEHIYV